VDDRRLGGEPGRQVGGQVGDVGHDVVVHGRCRTARADLQVGGAGADRGPRGSLRGCGQHALADRRGVRQVGDQVRVDGGRGTERVRGDRVEPDVGIGDPQVHGVEAVRVERSAALRAVAPQGSGVRQLALLGG
jgi:hypothetical protein